MPKSLKYILNLCPILFLLENVFGYNGTMLMIRGISIRHILYVLTFLSLYFQMFYWMYDHKTEATVDKIKRRANVLDYAVTLLIFSFIIWMTVIPLLMGTKLQLAKAEALDATLMLMLYYPLRVLFSTGELKVQVFETIAYFSLLIESILNIILFFGVSINTNFIDQFFGLWRKFFSSAILPSVILGYKGSPRVLFSTSLLLFFGLFICFKRIMKKENKLVIVDYAIFEIFIMAILCTMTKSIWYGAILGLVTAIVLRFFFHRKEFFNKKFIILILLGVLTVGVSNYTIFNNRVFSRVEASLSVNSNDENSSSSSKESTKSTKEKTAKEKTVEAEKEAASDSNNVRVEETKALLKKWTKSPVIGFGYGSYTTENTRSEDAIFSYEMTAPALLMKLGVVGIIPWVTAILAGLYMAFRHLSANTLTFWIFMFLGFGFAIQTNPFILSFTGMATIMLAFVYANCDGDVNYDE